MMVPPLSERPVTEEDEEQFRRESMPRKYTLRQRWADYRADARANRPKGAKARVRAWLHVEPFYWGMRAAYVVLVVGAVFAVYINGVANGWWHAWGEKPTVAATTMPAARPAPSASSSTDAAMSGGYQIGPDGVLVRPAEHAASTYTKPELPEEAKENTERGAELAAEHAFSLLILGIRNHSQTSRRLATASVRLISAKSRNLTRAVGPTACTQASHGSLKSSLYQSKSGERSPTLLAYSSKP